MMAIDQGRWLLVLALGVVLLPAVEVPDHIHRLRQAQVLPDELAGTWLRLLDGAWLTVEAGAPLADLAVGAMVRDGRDLLCLRPADGPAGEALSLLGIPVATYLPKEQMIRLATSGEALTPLSLPVLVWRWSDDLPWPWVDHPGVLGGLAGLCRQYNRDRHTGFRYDREQRCFVDAAGEPVRIAQVSGAALPGILEHAALAGGTVIALGDLLAGIHDDEAIGRSGILVRDRGILGVLDPEDEVVSADAPYGQTATAVSVHRVGDLFGPVPLFAYQRSRERMDRMRGGRYRPDNPIWDISYQRQLMVLAGMVIVIITLLRLSRRRRKTQGKP